MPRVPVTDGQSVGSAPLPGAYQSSIASPDLLGAGGRQTQQLGDAMQSTGGELARIRNQLLDQANALRVDDAVNQLTEKSLRLQHDPKDGFTSQTGYAAVSRDSGLPLSEEYTQHLEKSAGDIAANLSNDRQKAMFAMKANNIVATFRGHAMTYEGQQYKEYNLSTREATVENAKNALTLNFTDPDNVQQQVTRIRSAIEGGRDESGTFIPGSAQMQGKSAAWAKEKADDAISAAHEGAVKSALEQGNVNLAMAYFKAHGKEMTAKDVLSIQGTLQRDYDTRQGMTVGNQVVDTVRPQIVGDDMTRLTALVMGAESGGQRFDDKGGLLTSPKGAKGEMQVLDSTNKKPGYGVKPAQDDSPDERARVGRDYLAAMVKEYNGDVPKALAAYNAGPGRVQDAIKAAEADHGKNGDWFAYMPDETRKYVTGISAKFSTGVGAPPKPTLADLHDQAVTRLGPNPSPMAVKTATEQVTSRFTDLEKATKQREEEVTAQAMQQLSQNGGKYAELPASTRNALTQFAPGKIDDVMNFGARIAKGDDTTNPAVYLKLSDQNYLGKLTDAQLYGLKGELSQEDFKHFSAERAKVVSGQVINGPGDLNSSAIKAALDQRLRELKIDPTPKDDGGNDAARVGSIRRFVDTTLLARQRDAGKKFSDAEVVQQIDGMFANPAQLSGWLGTYSAPAISAKPGDIPSATRDAIKAAYKKQGVDDPTDAQILNGFLHLNARKNAK